MHDIYHMPTRADQDPERAKAATRVTLIGAVINLALAGGKFFAGIVGHSSAMVADAVHSLSDVVTDVVVLFSVQIAGQGADEEHPYGHGRAETIGTAVTGLALVLVGFYMITQIASSLTSGKAGVVPEKIALAGALVSIVSKEIMYQWTVRIGRKYANQSLIANAWHHRSDAISSIAALAGIAGAMAGFPILDPIAALVVVAMIIKVGWDISSQSVHDLMDASVPKDQLLKIRDVIKNHKSVRRYHELRTRRVGGDIFVDAHILVMPNISVSEAHNIAEAVRQNLKVAAGVTDALIHIDAEDDIHYRIIEINREKIEESVADAVKSIKGFNGVDHLLIHMLAGYTCLELVLDIDDTLEIKKAKKLSEELQKVIKEKTGAKEVVIHGALTAGMMDGEFAKNSIEGGTGEKK